MSGSLKRSQATLAAERQRQIEEEERTRRAAERRREQHAVLALRLSTCQQSILSIKTTDGFPRLQAAREGIVADFQKLTQDATGPIDPGILLSRLDALAMRIGDYERQINAERAERLHMHRQAESLLAELKVTVEGDEFSGIASAWFPERALALREGVQFASRALSQGQANVVVSQAQKGIDEANRLLEEARSRERKEREREVIIDALVSTMSEMGFAVDQPYYQSDSSDSGVAVRGRLPSGRGLSATVHIGGNVEYITEGFETLAFSDTDGREYRTCDDAEKALHQLHRIMDSSHGVSMSPPQWDGKPDNPQGWAIDHGYGVRYGTNRRLQQKGTV